MINDHKTNIKEFYNQHCFPGTYTLEDIELFVNNDFNRFVEIYKKACKNKVRVLEIGCGTGYLTNILASLYPKSQFDAVDFAENSVNIGKKFAEIHKITNVDWHCIDFSDFTTHHKYDVIISNGVLHHMPDFKKNLQKAKEMISNQGEMVIGVYNSYGKLYKKFFTVNYINDLLEKDQEECPYEVSFSHGEFKKYFPEFYVDNVYPGIGNRLVNLCNIVNFKNGGLTVYHMKKSK